MSGLDEAGTGNHAKAYAPVSNWAEPSDCAGESPKTRKQPLLRGEPNPGTRRPAPPPRHRQIVVLQITGRQVIDALENGICKYPALEGRCAAGRRGGGRLAMTVHLQQDPDFYA